jgi:hypothetical protein
MVICCLAVDLVKGLVGLTISTTIGGGNKRLLPFRLITLLYGVSIGVGFAT